MPRTQSEIDQAAARLEAHLALLDDGADPGPVVRGSPAAQALSRAVIAHAKAGAAVTEAVIDARAAGHSWTDIGHLLGVSRQTARERYADVANNRLTRRA
ncbi:hypothetical protein BH23ACT9_BH23ACT9_19370 [soil metagenome]